MRNESAHNYWIILGTLFIGLLLQIIPWPQYLHAFKPHWLMLILVYWILALPYRVGITTAFVVGVVMDLFSGTVLGIHAFIFSVIAYLVLFRFQLVRNLALWQQSFIILGLSIFYDLFLFIFQITIYQMVTLSPMIFLSSIVDGLLWTWIFLLLRQVRRSFAVD